MKRFGWFASLVLLLSCRLPGQTAGVSASDRLPDSPGAVAGAEAKDSPSQAAQTATPGAAGPCVRPDGGSSGAVQTTTPCTPAPRGNASSGSPASVDPYRPFLVATVPVRLSPKQKGYLAVRDIVDPFNLLTIVANSAFSIGIDPHTAYGPGLRGFGSNVGISLVEDTTGEFVGTFAVCSLFRQDPHYYRMPHARPVRRFVHALAHAGIAQSDSGKLIPNYENLITTPVTAEISNLYVPGIDSNAASTMERIMLGIATEPIGSLIAEFLPDLASRIHVRVVIVQHLLDRVARTEEN